MVTKQRDGKTGNTLSFELREYEVSKDEDGDPVISCALVETSISNQKTKLTGQSYQSYQVLCDLLCDDTKTIKQPPKKGMPIKTCVRITDFKDNFKKAGISNSDKPESVDRAFHRARKTLELDGHIDEWDGLIWLTDRVDNIGQTKM